MNGPPDTLQRCVRRMRMRAGLNAPPCDYVRGREVECTAPPLERPCWAPRPGARLKARPVWRSPRLGSSWIKDGSLEGQERWEAPRLHAEDKQMLAETGRKEKDDWRKERSSFKTAKPPFISCSTRTLTLLDELGPRTMSSSAVATYT